MYVIHLSHSTVMGFREAGFHFRSIPTAVPAMGLILLLSITRLATSSYIAGDDDSDGVVHDDEADDDGDIERH